MHELFKINRELTEDDFKSLWETGLFIFDTNTLLDLYRLPESAKNDLLSILQSEKLRDRIWIPFQVILEYTRNSVTVIKEQKQKFNEVKKAVDSFVSSLDSNYSILTNELDKLQLKKRHSVINPDDFVNDTLLDEPKSILNKFLKNLSELNLQQADINDKDPLRTLITQIFEGNIGEGFDKDTLDGIYKEGELRYKENIPPGYKDDSKKGDYKFQDKKYVRKYGDLVAWKEIIAKAKADKNKYIILITGDRKEDWWEINSGKTLGPRYELLNEIYFESPDLQIFHMYDTSGFMKYAKKYLDINVNDQSIKETKDILESNRINESDDIVTFDKVNISEQIKLLSQKLLVDVVFYSAKEPVPFVNFNRRFYSILLEILSNVKNHSLVDVVSVVCTEDAEHLIINFTNLISSEKSLVSEPRNMGLAFVRHLMEGYGHVEVMTEPDKFTVILFIDKRHTSLDPGYGFIIR